jgi:uncharacterized iron-regulated membrane protein
VKLARSRSSWRRAHFWLGLIAAFYIVFMSVTGSAIVFEHELYRAWSPDPSLSAPQETRLGDGVLRTAIASRHPNSTIIGLWDRRLSSGMAAEVWLDGSNGTIRRLIHPGTGEDLGDAQPFALRTLAFFRRMHVMALTGSPGRALNAIGALALIALSISGLAARRKASVSAGRKKNALTHHRVLGNVGSFFGLLWGVTALGLTLPTALARALGPESELVSEWAFALHTGSLAGWAMRASWACAGISLSLAAATGAYVWWRRLRIAAPRPERDRGSSVPTPEWR